MKKNKIYIFLIICLIFSQHVFAVKSNKVGSGTVFKSGIGANALKNFDLDDTNPQPLPNIGGDYEASGACEKVAGPALQKNTPGSCTLRLTLDGVTSEKVLNILQKEQNILTVQIGSFSGATANATASGGSGGGAITWTSNTPSKCSINSSSGVITKVAAGTCEITATKAASGLFASATSNSVSLTIAVTPDSGALSNSYPQWAYFNRTLSDSSANATIANTQCQSLGSGWRLPSYSETGPGSYVAWLDQNIGRGVQLFNSSGISNLQNAGWTTSYNYPYSSGFTINRIACYHP